MPSGCDHQFADELTCWHVKSNNFHFIDGCGQLAVRVIFNLLMNICFNYVISTPILDYIDAALAQA